MTDLENQIYRLIADSHGIKGREIAKHLDLDKKRVNQILSISSALKSLVTKDMDTYKWYLATDYNRTEVPTFISFTRNHQVDKAIHDFYFEDLVRGGYRNTSADAIAVADLFIDILLATGLDDILTYIASHKDSIPPVAPCNIPQFSSIDFAVYDLLDIVESNPGGDYALIGYCNDAEAKLGAQTKYGENHYKLASYLGLVTWYKPHILTPLGIAYKNLDEQCKGEILPYLILRIPVIQLIITTAHSETVSVCRVLGDYLSRSTVLRRSSNIKTLIGIICNSLSNSSGLMKMIDWSNS